jgi:hypothetical protein
VEVWDGLGMLRIDADLLIPGSAEPVSNGTVIVEDGRIAYAGPAHRRTRRNPPEQPRCSRPPS